MTTNAVPSDTAQLAEILAEVARKHQLPGAQLAVRQRNRVRTVETGETKYGGGEPVTAGSAFPLGSLTKPFTAALAMTLVADGDAELDAPLAAFAPVPGAGRVLTLRQLLSHTGGLAAGVDESEERSAHRGRFVARHCREADLAHPPGTVFSYSNVGYLVVGHLIETITGMSWYEALGSILLEPLGITPAYVVGGGDRPSRTVVSGHTVRPSDGRVTAVDGQFLPPVEAPAGALALSAADLVAFGSRFLDGSEVTAVAPGPLDPETVREMCRDQLTGITAGPFGMADGWGLGWARYDGGTDFYGHDGTGDGTSCHLRFAPRSGLAVAFTTNANTGHQAWTSVMERLHSVGIDVGDHTFSPPVGSGQIVTAPEECLGRYVNGTTEFRIHRGEDGRLLLSLDGRPHSELDCHGDLRFTLRELDDSRAVHTGRFLPGDGTGRGEYIQISGRLARRDRRISRNGGHGDNST